ncbi:hypothetical protein SNE40_021797 [Patella caerulea]|uniref:DUF7869 domain-containing protein n=1 Tax=Patella caerulea TaxID=87958 RepID=A0AAN8G558_PATCE
MFSRGKAMVQMAIDRQKQTEERHAQKSPNETGLKTAPDIFIERENNPPKYIVNVDEDKTISSHQTKTKTQKKPGNEPENRAVTEPGKRIVNQPEQRTQIEPEKKTQTEPEKRKQTESVKIIINQHEWRTQTQPEKIIITQPEKKIQKQPEKIIINQSSRITQPEKIIVNQPKRRTQTELEKKTQTQPETLIINQPEKRTQNESEKIIINQCEKIITNQPEKKITNQPEKRIKNQPEKRIINQTEKRNGNQQQTTSTSDISRNSIASMESILNEQVEQRNSDMSYESDMYDEGTVNKETFSDILNDNSEDLDYDNSDQDPDYKISDNEDSSTDSDVDNAPALILDEIPIDHEEVVDTGPQRKKRRISIGDWQKNIQKRRRMKGKSYKGLKKQADDGKWVYCVDKKERLLTPRGCPKKCDSSKIKSCSKFSEEERQEIFSRFWDRLDWNQRKVYVNSLVQSGAVGRKTTEGNSRRNVSHEYFLRKNGERLGVCKNMFLSTLGIGEKTVYGWLKDAPNGIPNKGNTINKITARRARDNHLRENIKQYLECLPKMESHYCRSSSKKQYLEPVFNSFADLVTAYKSYCTETAVPAASHTLIKEVFNELNLEIFSPKKDQCDVCCGYQAGNISQEDYDLHITRKEAARNEKVKDKERCEHDSSYRVVTLDLQSVLLCPKLQASALYYKTKLACHNFTIYDLNTKDVACYFWHEAEGDLTANSFASCVTNYIENMLVDDRIKTIVIYSDGCTYQNRNSVLSNALLKIAITKNVRIFQKYLEKGHTQMEVDSVHSVIERKLKKRPIYIPQNYVDIFRSARPRQPYNVFYVHHDFFRRYSDLGYYHSIRPGVKVGDPVVTDIRVMNYSPDGDIKYQLVFDDVLHDLPRKAKNVQIGSQDIQPNRLHDHPIPIKTTKFSHLQDIKAVIPTDYHSFYDALPHA